MLSVIVRVENVVQYHHLKMGVDVILTGSFRAPKEVNIRKKILCQGVHHVITSSILKLEERK